MKKIILITLALYAGSLFGQTMPTSYNLGDERLGKVNDPTPLSNSTIDIAINEGDVWLTRKKDEDTVYAFSDLVYGMPGIKSHAGCRFTLKSVQATPETEISVLSQSGGCEWTEDEEGLHITVSRTHTVQFIKTPPLSEDAEDALKKRSFVWGPDWPVAVKITNVRTKTETP